MRAHDQARAVRDPGAGLRLAGRGHGPHEQRDVQPEFAHALRVLLGKDLCGRHHGGLVPALGREQHGEEGHQGLAAAHIALEHAAHAPRRGHVRVDLAQGPDLRAREGEGKAFVQRPDALVGAPERDPGPFARGAVALPGLQELQEEEFVVREAARGLVHLGEGARAVQGLECVRKLHQIAPRGGRKILLGPHLLDEAVEVLRDHAPEDPLGQLLGRGVDGEDRAG